MSPPVSTKDPAAVEAEVQAACRAMFRGADVSFVSRAFDWAKECFSGHYLDYQPVDAPYHDLEHTLQGTLCLARLLRGRHKAGAEPALTERMFRLGLLAILLHDTGYLKKRGDRDGTGAKYTVTHVERSANFARALLTDRGFNAADATAAGNMIHCTGIDAALNLIRFQDEQERIVGYALGTADLLGQMAADDYVEKLPKLYSEFAEAAQFSQDTTHFVTRYASAADLMRRTPAFWDEIVLSKLERDFGALYRYLNDPYPDGPNPYLQRVEANMSRLRQRVASAAA
jgi:hypothetical protein